MAYETEFETHDERARRALETVAKGGQVHAVKMELLAAAQVEATLALVWKLDDVLGTLRDPRGC